MEILTVQQARRLLMDYDYWVSSRDKVVRQAFASGLTKTEIFRRTGISRTTINRILQGLVTPNYDAVTPNHEE